MSKMFYYNDKPMKTWNVFSGCRYDCNYCWAKSLIATRLKDSPKYKECGFLPTTHEKEFNKSFKLNDFVFISPMGDLSFASFGTITRIIDFTAKYNETNFLVCSKNPGIYAKYNFPTNVYLGTTIETNRHYHNTKAPDNLVRYGIMYSLEVPNPLFVSIEPIMDFDFPIFVKWILDINPKIVEIGADNYNNHLPEPTSYKITELIKVLKEANIEVVKKKGIERLSG